MAIFVRQLRKEKKGDVYMVSVPVEIVRAMGLEQGDLLDIEDIDTLIVLKRHETSTKEE